MSNYFIEGGHRIGGELAVHGAKNAALPILAATLLCENSILHNCPSLSDVEAACHILEYLGCDTSRQGDTVSVRWNGAQIHHNIPDSLMREMRSSVVFLGAILSRWGEARVSFPGGCELGPRPIDIHLAALRKLGVWIEEDHGYLNCRVPDGRMQGCELILPFPSVGATENILLAACLAKGETVVRNAAREPEISDLAGFLNACGAKIEIRPDSTIVIEGVDSLARQVEYTVIPDRIAAATYLCAAAITQGELTVTHCEPAHLAAILPHFEEMGCRVITEEDKIHLQGPRQLLPVRSVRTMPYPGFPTDAQSPLMAVSTIAQGTSIFIENIFENRYKHVSELMRMGASIKVEGRVAIVEGVPALHSATLQCTDLRGGAAISIAALAAQGVSEITDIKHIQRGYENFDKNLSRLGAKITRSR